MVRVLLCCHVDARSTGHVSVCFRGIYERGCISRCLSSMLFYSFHSIRSIPFLATMGKAQFQRKTAQERRRHNPIRVPDAHLPHGQIPLKGKEEAMLPILKKVRRRRVGKGREGTVLTLLVALRHGRKRTGMGVRRRYKLDSK